MPIKNRKCSCRNNPETEKLMKAMKKEGITYCYVCRRCGRPLYCNTCKKSFKLNHVHRIFTELKND